MTTMQAEPVDERRDRSPERDALVVLAVAIIAGVLIRLLVFRGSGFPSDVGTFMAWAERASFAPGPGSRRPWS